MGAPLTLEYLDPATLTPQAANPRDHPAVQAEAINSALDAVGWAGAALYNKRTGRLLDGHLRRQEAIARGEKLPTLMGDWPEEQEDFIVRTFDPIGAMARENAEKLDALTVKVIDYADAGLIDIGQGIDEILKQINTSPATVGTGEEEGVTRGDVPDALFPTNNEWQIPLLDASKQADAVDLPVVTWGSIARTSRMKGTWHFYTDDDRYIELWVDPSPVVNTQCVNAVEPNFSVYDQMPRAVGLYRIYQKRWIARWWQSLGVKVFVDLNVAEPFADLNLLGVPEGWRSYATRGYTERMDGTEREYDLAVERAGSADILFVVIGGGKEVAELCGRKGWVHVQERMTKVREARRAQG